MFIYQVLNSINLGIPQRRIPGEGNVSPLQYSHLENSMDRGAWWATVHGITRVRYDLATKPGEELGFPGGSEGKESACNAGDWGQYLGWEYSWRREWLPTPVFLPGESCGQRSLGQVPWGGKESDMTERLTHKHRRIVTSQRICFLKALEYITNWPSRKDEQSVCGPFLFFFNNKWDCTFYFYAFIYFLIVPRAMQDP